MRSPTALLLAGLLAGAPLAARAAAPQAAAKAAAPAGATAPVSAGAAKAAARPPAPAAEPAPQAAPKRFVIHTVDTGATHHTVLANVHYRLKNGLKVVLLEDRTQPAVRVSIWYHSGSCNEPAGLHGMAHLFEHLMFEGSLHVGQSGLSDSGGFYGLLGNIWFYLQAAGASGVNAQTEFETTRFFETVPPENLETALWLESDRMGYLDAFKQKRLHKQRNIVDNELRQRIQTTPYAHAGEVLWGSLFPKPHPCHTTPAGSIQDLAHVTVKDMRAYYDPAYAPGDATLVLAGSLPPNTKALVNKYFGTLPARRPMPPIDYRPVTLDHEIVKRVTDPLADDPRVMLAWHTPKILTQGAAVADLVAALLTGSPATRLDQALESQHLVAQLQAGIQKHGFGSVLEIMAQPRPGVTTAQVTAAIDKVMATLTTPPSKAELDRARMRLETHRLEGLQGLTAKANLLQRYTLYTGRPDGFFADLARYEKVTPEDIADFARRYLGPSHRVRVVITPGGGDKHHAPGKKVADATEKEAR